MVNFVLESFIKESSFIGIWAVYEPNALDDGSKNHENIDVLMCEVAKFRIS